MGEVVEVQHGAWMPVESSAVEALLFVVEGSVVLKGGGAANYGSLYVRFQRGAIYQYRPTLEGAVRVLLSADSVGGSLWHVLVPGSGQRREDLEDKEAR